MYRIFDLNSRSNHSGHNGSIPSSASMQGMVTGGGGGSTVTTATTTTTTTSNDLEATDNGDHMLNNNTLDNGMDMCDVPDHVANQKRHVSEYN